MLNFFCIEKIISFSTQLLLVKGDYNMLRYSYRFRWIVFFNIICSVIHFH